MLKRLISRRLCRKSRKQFSLLPSAIERLLDIYHSSGLDSIIAVSSASDCRSRGCKFGSQLGHTAFVEIDLEIIFTFILHSPQIQEGQFLVNGESMCTSTDHALGGLSLPRKNLSKLLLSTLGKIFSRRHIETFFFVFPLKQVLTFHANCLQWRQFA